MQIPGPIPFHAAKAYGIQPHRSVARVAPVEAVASSAGSATLEARLVAAKVGGEVRFDGPMPASSGSLSLYSRAADHVEAALE